MNIIVGLAVAWLLLQIPAGILLGRALRRADTEQQAARERALRLVEKETAK